MRILITGATGQVGRLVVRALVAAGVEVHALTRDPAAADFPAGVRVFRGDLAEPESLRGALRGVQRMYLFPYADTAREVVGMAADAGVRRIVVLSSGAVAGGYDTTFHFPVEQAVEQSGLRWTHLRPGEFMANKLWLWGPSIRAEGLVYEPFPELAWVPVHERDIADVAVTALLDDGHNGAAYMLNGPGPISRREQVAAIAAAIGREVRLVRVSAEEARARYLRQGGFAAANADFLLGFESYDGGEPDEESPLDWDLSELRLPTAAEVTGKPARDFAQWARDRAEDFRSAGS